MVHMIYNIDLYIVLSRDAQTTDMRRISINVSCSTNGIYMSSKRRARVTPSFFYARHIPTDSPDIRAVEHELLEKYSATRWFEFLSRPRFNFRAYFLSKHDRTYSRYSPRVTKIFKGGVSSVSPVAERGGRGKKKREEKKEVLKNSWLPKNNIWKGG